MTGAYGSLEVRDYSEILVLVEVFADNTYAHEQLPESVDLVIDLGCNIGAAALWFAHRYPDARVIGVEADPETADTAKRNTSACSQIEIVHAAASDHSGSETLWVSRASWTSSTVRSNGRAVTVPAVPLDDLIAGGGSRTLLKIDIEGAEHAVLGGSQRLGDVEFIAGEYHPVPGATYQDMVVKLKGFHVDPPVNPEDRQRTFAAYRTAPISAQ